VVYLLLNRFFPAHEAQTAVPVHDIITMPEEEGYSGKEDEKVDVLNSVTQV